MRTMPWKKSIWVMPHWNFSASRSPKEGQCDSWCTVHDKHCLALSPGTAVIVHPMGVIGAMENMKDSVLQPLALGLKAEKVQCRQSSLTVAQHVHWGFWQLLQRGQEDCDREGPSSTCHDMSFMQWVVGSFSELVFFTCHYGDQKDIILYRHV